MVRVGEVAAVLGGGALLLGSWRAVATSDHVSALEAQAFAAVNRLPDPAWPIVWLPMQLGSLVGSLAAVGVTWRVTRDRRIAMGLSPRARPGTGPPRV
jgi:hypothetical protein